MVIDRFFYVSVLVALTNSLKCRYKKRKKMEELDALMNEKSKI